MTLLQQLSDTGLAVWKEFINAAVVCATLRECLVFASTPRTRPVHVIVWLQISHAVLSCRVLRNGDAFLVEHSDLLD